VKRGVIHAATAILVGCLGLVTCAGGLRAQEAQSGFTLSGTVSEVTAYSHQLSASPREGSPLNAGFRAVLYPTWKLSDHWTVTAAVQAYSRPYFYEQFSTQGYGLKTDVLQANLGYSQFWNDASVVVRAGELSSAFGSFLLRYDDAVNPLIDKPMSYGYYYQGVSVLGLAGAQVDVTVHKFDMRAQFTNSSPANRRSIFDNGQYGDWAGGVGYTLMQGLRIGASTYRGPYLDFEFPYYFPGEADPHVLPATAVGVDVEWGRGPWNVNGEWQRFQNDYHVIPNYIQQVGYVEARRTLSPRWYAAARIGTLRPVGYQDHQSYEFAVAYRPARFELVKLDYEILQGALYRGTLGNTLAIQFVTTFGPLSMAAK
jgi:hypothetical protein